MNDGGGGRDQENQGRAECFPQQDPRHLRHGPLIGPTLSGFEEPQTLD